MITFFLVATKEIPAFAKICVAASLETLHEDPTIRGIWKQWKWKTEMVKMKIVYFLMHTSLKRPLELRYTVHVSISHRL